MNAQAILNEFARRGIAVRADGENLIARPLSRVDPELREAARQHKDELLRLLADGPEPPCLPIDLSRIADAIARQPRSPFLNDLAIATIVKAAIRAQAAMTGVTPAVQAAALRHCRELQDRIVGAIEHRDYQSAYEIAARLDRLPREITELRPQ